MRRTAWILGLVLLGGCGGGRQNRCQRVCEKEARCAAELEADDVDEAECIAECKDLERDPELRRFVDQHLRCVEHAVSCRAVLDCP